MARPEGPSSDRGPHLHDSADARHEASHDHGVVDPQILATERGLAAVRWSLAGLAATALFQALIVAVTGSVALLADTIHNFGDAATALPLWIAFRLGQRPPTARFPYGYGRVEDLAGVAVVGTILLSAIVSGYESASRLLAPRPVAHWWAVAGAAAVGFLGNEAVARYRIRVGREIASAALEADGRHARVDALTSLTVLFGTLGVRWGYPIADPLVGLLITAAILRIVWQSGKTVFTRLLDGVDPTVLDEVRRVARGTPDVAEVTEVRARWHGHRLQAELNLAVDPALSVERGHHVAREVRHRLLHHLPYLSDAVVHVDPASASGERHHRVSNHAHDGMSPHSH